VTFTLYETFKRRLKTSFADWTVSLGYKKFQQHTIVKLGVTMNI